jgi:hypothetical protein
MHHTCVVSSSCSWFSHAQYWFSRVHCVP